MQLEKITTCSSLTLGGGGTVPRVGKPLLKLVSGHRWGLDRSENQNLQGFQSEGTHLQVSPSRASPRDYQRKVPLVLPEGEGKRNKSEIPQNVVVFFCRRPALRGS